MRKNYLILIILSLFFDFSIAKTLLINRVINDNLQCPTQITFNDNKLYILEGMDNQVKVFSLDGKLLNSFGSRGQGPGQFQNAVNFQIFKDKIYVLDYNPATIHVFDKHSLRFLKKYRVPLPNPSEGFRIDKSTGYFYFLKQIFKGGDQIFKMEFKNGQFNKILSFHKAQELKNNSLKESRKNGCTIDVLKNKLYFAYTYNKNELLEYSGEGKLIGGDIFPFKNGSLKTKKLNDGSIIFKGGKVKRIKCFKNNVYILCKSGKGENNFVIFEYTKKGIKEKYILKGDFNDFEIVDNKIYTVSIKNGAIAMYFIKEKF